MTYLMATSSRARWLELIMTCNVLASLSSQALAQHPLESGALLIICLHVVCFMHSIVFSTLVIALHQSTTSSTHSPCGHYNATISIQFHDTKNPQSYLSTVIYSAYIKLWNGFQKLIHWIWLDSKQRSLTF